MKLFKTIFKIKKNYFFSKIISLFGQNLILKSNINNHNFSCLEDAEFSVYSQNGEDGILNFIINKLKIKKPNFIEIGVGDYTECNTRFIYETYFSSGIIIDCLSELKKKVSKNVNIWKGNLGIIESFVSKENINDIINRNCNFEVDIFSLDIDGIDYWILKNLSDDVKPKIFVIEYNSNFGLKKITVPYIQDFDRKKYHYSHLCYGASITAIQELMHNKGYYLLGVNRLKNNAFFISNNFERKKFFSNIKEQSLEEAVLSNFSEGRDKNGLLSYLNKKQQLKEIEECEVIDLSKTNFPLTKIKDIF